MELSTKRQLGGWILLLTLEMLACVELKQIETHHIFLLQYIHNGLCVTVTMQWKTLVKISSWQIKPINDLIRDPVWHRTCTALSTEGWGVHPKTAQFKITAKVFCLKCLWARASIFAICDLFFVTDPDDDLWPPCRSTTKDDAPQENSVVIILSMSDRPYPVFIFFQNGNFIAIICVTK